MAKFRIFFQDQHLKDVELLQHQSPFRIGRRPENTLVLPDRTVSREHAVLQYDPRRRCWLAHNLSRTNPLMINAKVIDRPVVLFDGDEMQVGLYRLRFVEDREAAPSPPGSREI